MEINAVIFDLDNTLWDFETNSKEALHELFSGLHNNHNFEFDFTAFHTKYVKVNYRYWSAYEKGLIDKQTLRYGRFQEVFHEFGFTNTAEINSLADEYLEISPRKTVVFDGTYEVLEHLYKKYPMAIITNGFNEVVEHKITNCKLGMYFKHIQTSEDAGVQKPHPKIFEIVANKLHVKPVNCVMVGDNLETDIKGGKGVGMKTILFDPKKEHTTYTDLKINNLKQLKDIF